MKHVSELIGAALGHLVTAQINRPPHSGPAGVVVASPEQPEHERPAPGGAPHGHAHADPGEAAA